MSSGALSTLKAMGGQAPLGGRNRPGSRFWPCVEEGLRAKAVLAYEAGYQGLKPAKASEVGDVCRNVKSSV